MARPASAVWSCIGCLYIAAAVCVGQGSLAATTAGVLAVYAFGYVAGALLIEPGRAGPTVAMTVVRTIVGLQLSTIVFLLSLALGLPWSMGPAAIVAAAIIRADRSVFSLPRIERPARWSSVAGGVLVAVALAPIVTASIRMAPGEFPPMFFNVDTAYSLEKVHALVSARAYPPDSLGVLGGRSTYHFGTHGMAALLARSTGMAPHHALFLFVAPLLACGVAAAAAMLARQVAPALPSFLALPLLVTSVPTFWYPFWHPLQREVSAAVQEWSLTPLTRLAGGFELWGVASIVSQNVIGHFLALAAVAAVVGHHTLGWRLAIFLIATAVLFKATVGVTLVAAFCAGQGIRCALERSLRPLFPVVAAAVAFGLVYGAFWILPSIPSTYRMLLTPFEHLELLRQQGQLLGFAADISWLLLPVLVVLPVRAAGPRWETLTLLAFALTPFVLVNVLSGDRAGRGMDRDWLQTLILAPFFVRALAIQMASRRWTALGRLPRAAFVVVVALAVVPSLAVAARYAHVIVMHPAAGHEFVDNRRLAEALETVPKAGALIVTNDLRYPADGFSRTQRQLQIPALFGHQAFAVNYAYESYAFSGERFELQKLLTVGEWSAAIDDAVRRYGWTHLVIHKDYPHPASIPLERVFDAASYAVYRFPRR